MGLSVHRVAIFLALAAQTQPLPADAQDVSPFFGGVSASLAFVGSRHVTLDRTGYQLGGYVGRRLIPSLAAFTQITVTSVGHSGLYPPCFPPGCPTSGVTAVGIAPSVQVYEATGSQRIMFSLTPGAVWFVRRPIGTPALSPLLAARLELGWLVGERARLGFGFGSQWWVSSGTIPRWTFPLGVTVELP